MKKKLTLITCAILMVIATNLFAQDTLVAWTFPSTSADAIADKAILINSTALLSCQYGTIGASSYHSIPIDFTSNGVPGTPDKSAKATGWNDGSDSAYWMISFKTTGYGNITLSSKIQAGGTNPGPKDFKAQYKISESGVWTDVLGGAIICSNDWTTGDLVNVTLPIECDNQPNPIFIRWLLTSNTTFNGGTLAASGISKIDDIYMKGTLSTSIENYSKMPVVSVFPNPTTDIITVSGIKEFSDVNLVNSAGTLVYSLKSASTSVTIKTSDFPKGLYFLFIHNEKVEVEKSIITVVMGK